MTKSDKIITNITIKSASTSITPMTTLNDSHQKSVPPTPSSHLGWLLKTVPDHNVIQIAATLVNSNTCNNVCFPYGRTIEVITRMITTK